MLDNFPRRDAHIVNKLKKTGFLVVGKANLSEWANFRGRNSVSGWSSFGGQTKNPYDLEYNWEVGTPVSPDVVNKYYAIDFDKHYAEAIHVFGSQEDFFNLPEPIQHVLVNMCFNLGGTRLSKFRNMLKACREHNWDEMARQMQDSRWFYQVGRRSVELQQVVLEQR